MEINAGVPSVCAYIKVTYRPEGDVLTIEKKLQNTTSDYLLPIAEITLLLLIWQGVSMLGLVPSFMLPSPVDVVKAFVKDFPPLLVLWFGYEMLPKIIRIVLVVFFPIAVNLLDGYQQADADTINLLRAMGANDRQIFRYVKFPAALGHFFSSLKIAVSYAVVSAVISEWLGGFNGLGVYMTRVKKAYAFDIMFAVILLISALSLLLMWLVKLLQRKMMPWEHIGTTD